MLRLPTRRQNSFIQGSMLLLSLGVSLSLTTQASAATSIPDELTLQAGHQKLILKLSELKKKLPTTQVTLTDPVYSKPKTWDTFQLQELLKLLGKTPDSADEIIFQAADGYAPSVSRDKLQGHEAYLAYQEHHASGSKGKNRFEPVRQGKASLSPAPFYLLWKDGKSIGEEYPWPYQLVKIEFVSFREKYAKIYPSGFAKESPELRGFERYKNLCIRCHSINLVGGEIGPELNTPKNVLEYWDPKTLRQFIHDASSFRARSKMPNFPNLSEKELDDIFAYLRWAKDHKLQIQF